MAKNFLIGIGGTGAKCIESFLHVAASGAGPDDTWVGLIDQDQSNGNVSRTRQLLSTYTQLRTRMRDSAISQLADGNDFLRTNIELPSESLWCPLDKANLSLRAMFNYDMLRPELKALMDALYDPASEQNMPLEMGFRGRPAIGAPVILSQAESGHPFWEGLLDSVRQMGGGGLEVRIFLVGSIFGGTGAAGFPNVARAIRAKLKKAGIERGVSIGGAMMLPYFSFPVGEEDGVFALSDVFLEQAQGALHYYERLFEREPVFDSVYLLGWRPLIPLRAFHPGKNDQRNPPLVPELYAALAAVHFLLNGAGNERAVLQVGRRDTGSVGWADLPRVRDNQPVENCLGRLLRFAWTYHYLYHPALLDNPRAIHREAWYRRMVRGREVDLADGETRKALEQLDGFCVSVLEWMANLSFASTSNDLSVKLARIERYADFGVDPLAPAVLRPVSRRDRHSFSDLIIDRPSSNLSRVFEHMTYASVPESSHGLGAVVGGLFDACRL
jgi:hypothetical protein